MPNFYPTLNEPAIKQVLQIYENNPSYFDDPACPYSDPIKDFFKTNSQASDFDTHTEKVKFDEDGLNSEIETLYSELKKYGTSAITSENSADKNTFFRLSVGLLEKIVEVKSKLNYVTNVNAFIEEVLSSMQEILNADQRNEFMDRIRPYTTDYKPPAENTPVIDAGNAENNTKPE